MTRGGEALHVSADLGDDHMRDDVANPDYSRMVKKTKTPVW
jgi:hypothetical protein